MAKLETIEIIGKKGHLIINASDLADWKAKGYKTLDESIKESAKKSSGVGSEKESVKEVSAKKGSVAKSGK